MKKSLNKPENIINNDHPLRDLIHKDKISFKLVIYFVTSLILFAVIISGVFITLFRSYTIDLNKTELEDQAVRIAAALSTMNTTNGRDQGGGYGAYINFISNIDDTDIWIVDSDLNIISYGNSQHAISSTADLPANAETIVEQVFAGQTEYSEAFSNLFDTPTVTVGTPIIEDNAIVGVVLLHSSVEGIDSFINKGIQIMGLSIAIALIIAILAAVVLSLKFTKPLKMINDTTIALTEGHYTVKTNVSQNDEIGTLAGNVDTLAVRLDKADQESARLEKMRQDFVTNISHELRTPVTVIRGSLEALNDGVVTNNGQIKEYYGQMLSESKHLQRLINDLLDLSKLQNTDFSLAKEPVNLRDIIDDVVRSSKHIAKDKEITIDFTDHAGAITLNGDYGRLRQMLMIIMDNALKFSPPHGHISLLLSGHDTVTLSIRDEGPGIDPQELPYIFDKFYKTNSNINKNGSGLGLAIAKQIAVRHAITIDVESEPAKGTTFRFSFINNNA